MYQGPVVYESHVTDYFFLIFIAIIGILIGLFLMFSLGKIFQKAEKKFEIAFIPFYNLFPLLEIVHLPKIYFIFLLIPVINLIPIFQVSKNMAKVFKKDSKFVAGLFFLPFVFYPILAFSKDKYIGINEEKVEEIVLQNFIRENVETTQVSEVLKTNQAVSVGTNTVIASAGQNGVLQADNRILEQQKQKPIEYIECPICKNKVKKDSPVCFICGHKF